MVIECFKHGWFFWQVGHVESAILVILYTDVSGCGGMLHPKTQPTCRLSRKRNSTTLILLKDSKSWLTCFSSSRETQTKRNTQIDPKTFSLLSSVSGGPANSTSFSSQRKLEEDDVGDLIFIISSSNMNRTTFSLLFLVSAIFAQSLSGPLLSNVPVDVLRSGGLTDGLFNGLKLSRNLGALNGILGGLLGGKGLVVTASYCTSAYVHADIAAHIAIDLPTQRGLLNDLNDVCGKVTTAAAVVDRITSTTTVLDIKAKADVQVVVSVFADIKVMTSY